MWPDNAEPDPEEEARVRKAVVMAARGKVDALRAAAKPGSYDYHFLRRDAETFDDHDIEHLRRLMWFHRSRLSTHMRPRVNPEDPIVREQEAARGQGTV